MLGVLYRQPPWLAVPHIPMVARSYVRCKHPGSLFVPAGRSTSLYEEMREGEGEGEEAREGVEKEEVEEGRGKRGDK